MCKKDTRKVRISENMLQLDNNPELFDVLALSNALKLIVPDRERNRSVRTFLGNFSSIIRNNRQGKQPTFGESHDLIGDGEGAASRSYIGANMPSILQSYCSITLRIATFPAYGNLF